MKIGTTLEIYKSEIYSKYTGIDVSYIKTDISIKCVLNFTKQKYSYVLFTIDLRNTSLNNKYFTNITELNNLLQRVFEDIEVIRNNLDLFIYKLDNIYYKYYVNGSTKLSIFDIDYTEFKTYLILNDYLKDKEILDYLFLETKNYVLCKKILFHIFHN